MSKHIKALGMLLVVCFLMSVTVASVSAKTADDAYSPQESKEKLLSEELSKGKNIFIKKLIIAKNIFVFTGDGKHKLLRAAALKKAMSESEDESEE